MTMTTSFAPFLSSKIYFSKLFPKSIFKIGNHTPTAKITASLSTVQEIVRASYSTRDYSTVVLLAFDVLFRPRKDQEQNFLVAHKELDSLKSSQVKEIVITA
ncbi:uncharacterized protein EV154DRAFT_480180 [Mucor mucedo]|uniref:uncharacterized protein n=1 Tax=Mucor mucedo TaxID=29922 RepID=UPI00221E6A96|nr:uncharacterized protein EV154DRAFT_480180 [Mucor mucedo]KAI7892691.1 hypothetical protein EV154DRAFT_480180 [Mucor mucedo]